MPNHKLAGRAGMIKIFALALAVPWTLALPTAHSVAAAASAEDPGCHSCLQSASGLFARGDNEGAAKLLTQWQSKCPNSLQLCLMLNTVLMRIPDGKKRALEAAERACTIAPSSMLAHFQKAMTLMTLQQGTAAAVEFQRVVELDPTSYESWLALSELLGAEGKSQAAKDAENHAAQLSPSARQSTLNTLLSKDRAGNIKGIKEEVDKIVDNPTTSPETLLIVGEEVFKLGYFAEAALVLSQAKTKYPDAPQVKTLLPYALFEVGKFDESVKLISADKSTAGGAIQQAILGLDALASGNFDAGQKQIENAAPAGDNQGLVHLAHGYLALRSGRYKEAIEKFSDAMNKNKAMTVAKIYVAQANLEMGDLKEAIAQAKESHQKASGLKVRAEAIELMARLRDGEDSGTNLLALKNELVAYGPLLAARDQSLAEAALGELAIKDKDPGRAKELFTSACGHLSDCVQARVGMGRVDLAEGDNKAAITELDQALALAPGSVDGLSLKALALVETGDLAGAETLLTKASAEGELPATTCLALGKAYQKAGHNKQAVQYFKQALQAGATGSALEQIRDALVSLGEKIKGK